eukprot:TRINITY_DN3899_c0_g1_i4.p3 TRINITY_DN3899_c0_g1~~TRINITY_DN3899_c0_g1_i4.p3  ORF type:complete len:126 (-),score=18.34 TRINITY_DN3899_c0_g1_i4:456-833(-)
MNLIALVVIVLGSLCSVSYSFISGVNVFSGAATPTSIAAGHATAFGQKVGATTTSAAGPYGGISTSTAVASSKKKPRVKPPPKKPPTKPPPRKPPTKPPTKKPRYTPPKKNYHFIPRISFGKKHD